jgi:hypothetical protein
MLWQVFQYLHIERLIYRQQSQLVQTKPMRYNDDQPADVTWTAGEYTGWQISDDTR